MTSQYFEKKKTFYGGRGLFATKSIPANTLIHTALSPYASVIYREYRKEVCAYCFAYAFESNRNAWNIRHEKEGSGVWFCSNECKDLWEREENVEGMVIQMNISIDQMDRRLKKAQSRAHPISEGGDQTSLYLSSSHSLDKVITQDFLDSTWRSVESRKGTLEEPLNDLELDLVRFLTSGLIRRCLEHRSPEQHYDPLDHDGPPKPNHLHAAGTWSGFLDLQDNELNYIRAEPEVLDRQIRAYIFLRMVAIPMLKPYVRTAEFVRAILGRDQGNAFGIFEIDGDDMMGVHVTMRCQRTRSPKSFLFFGQTALQTSEKIVADGVFIFTRRQTWKKAKSFVSTMWMSKTTF
ncbi:hypothetical protein D9758_002427 [Tetrapyrgos nigripes]|uniref:Uncharacterized protein n=1 Tax=Tetrapyrgos nigripes TaxID=182062 RepID=A0A8H5LSF8_9AGAR|nr:hypothetical protein D9758_002427 [Tetrapyrgos nigripes]